MPAPWPTFFKTFWRLVWLAGLLFAASGAMAATAPRSGAIGLIGVRLGGDGFATRLVLDLDAAITGKLLTAESSTSRLVVSLPSILSASAMQGQGRGLVTDWSVREDRNGARLILNLAPGAVMAHRFLIPPGADGGPWRYVIDVKTETPNDASSTVAKVAPRLQAPQIAQTPTPQTTTVNARLLSGGVASPLARISTAFHASPGVPPLAGPDWPSDADSQPSTEDVQAPIAQFQNEPGFVRPAVGRADSPAARPVAISRSSSIRPATSRVPKPIQKVIVIDAGHGGHDPGARSLVRNEKDITLAAALALKGRLEKSGRYRVVLTRATDVFIPLEARVQIARKAGADLFISLHADSAGSDPTPHGASIYTLSDSGQRRVNNVLGPHEWFSNSGDRRSDPGIRQILLDLTQRSTRNRSSQFASILIDHISDKVNLLPRSHRDAGYFVLLAPDVPAVLMEMGFITNPSDEMRLTDPVQREQLMAGVAEAIDAYFLGGTRLAAG